MPVGIGSLITVDTTAPVDVAAVASEVRRLHGRTGPGGERAICLTAALSCQPASRQLALTAARHGSQSQMSHDATACGDRSLGQVTTIVTRHNATGEALGECGKNITSEVYFGVDGSEGDVMAWTVIVVEPCLSWLHELRRTDRGTLIQISQAITTLAEEVPGLGRPLVDTVAGSKLANLKELRPGS